MVVMYICEKCDCSPLVDLNWSVTKGHGKGTGWWCTKCGEMWTGKKLGSYMLGIQLNHSRDSMHYFRTHVPPQECNSFMEVRKLATNAMKYGALSNAKGSIALALTQDEEAVSFVWTETGADIPDDGEPVPGFGTRLLDLAINRQLGGSYERRWHTDGLTLTMTVRRDRVQDL